MDKCLSFGGLGICVKGMLFVFYNSRYFNIHKLFIHMYVCTCSCLVAKMSLTFCDPIDCSPPGSSVQRISQVRILKRVAISFSRGSSQPRDWTHISSIGRSTFFFFFITEKPPGKPHVYMCTCIQIDPWTMWGLGVMTLHAAKSPHLIYI